MDERLHRTSALPRRRSEFKSVLLWGVLAGFMVISVIVNLVVIPTDHIVASLFAIPMLVAAVWGSASSIAIIDLFSVSLYIISSIINRDPVIVVFFGALGLAVVGVLAVQLLRQRQAVEHGNTQLRLSQERLRVGLSQANVVVFNQDLDLRYTGVANPHPALNDAMLLGKTDRDVFPPDQAAQLDVLKQRVLKTGSGIRADLSLTVGDETRSYDLRIEPLLDINGSIIGLTGSTIDITDRKRFENERELIFRREQVAYQRLQQFVALVAHDLSQPLTTIRGTVQLMGRRMTAQMSDAEARRLRLADEATKRMIRLANDLREAAAIGSGHFTIDRTRADLIDIVRAVVAEQQATTEIHEIVFNGPDQLPGEWDRDRIAQCLNNLVSNAIKYTPEGGEIRVTVEATGDESVVRVADSGIGIDPDQLSDLFEPFSRADDARHFAGTGLGLFICKAIVEAHGGHIDVTSIPGEGTTFIVFLPCSAG